MSYARKTCHACGMIKPVDLMHKVIVQKQVGHTKDQLTAGTLAGALLFENKASIRRINRRLFANNKRGHFRNQEKWECYPGTCHHDAKTSRPMIDQAIEEQVLKQAKANLLAEDIKHMTYVIAGVVGGGFILWSLFT